MFLHSIHTLLKQYSGSIQGNASLLTLATPWVHLGYTLGRVCEIRHKSIKNPSNRKRKIDISTDEHIRNYQNWLIVARASRVTHRRSQVRRILGMALILISIYFMLFRQCIKLPTTKSVQVGAGTLSGLMGGFFGMQGPPAVLYFSQSEPTKEHYMAMAQTYFLIGNMMMT